MPRITAEQNKWRTWAILSHSVPTVNWTINTAKHASVGFFPKYHIRHCSTKFNITSSLLHFASISNLDRQHIQIFVLQFFHLWSGTNTEYSLGVQSHSFFESTSPCFHSSWHEQQHEAENGIKKHSNIAQKTTIYNWDVIFTDICTF